jgi:hypothetical protein
LGLRFGRISHLLIFSDYAAVQPQARGAREFLDTRRARRRLDDIELCVKILLTLNIVYCATYSSALVGAANLRTTADDRIFDPAISR